MASKSIMTNSSSLPGRNLQAASYTRLELESLQLEKLNRLLIDILPANSFYAQKFAGLRQPIESLHDFARLPLTLKDELAVTAPANLLAVNQTYSTDKYSRYHQTSGTRGRPQIVLETQNDWEWWMDVWQRIYDAADVRADDRVLLAFSFGPFIGFWSAFDAAVRRGCLLLPCGGMTTRARIELAKSSNASVVLCTPTYALHMAEVGEQHGIPVANLGVRQLVLAGEPGGRSRPFANGLPIFGRHTFTIMPVRPKLDRGALVTAMDKDSS